MDFFDIATLNISKWDLLLNRVRRGKRVTKPEVVELLRSDEPLTDNGRQFLADIIEGKHKFERGNTDWYPDDLVRKPKFVVSLVRSIERCIKDPHNLPDDFDDEDRQHYRELHRRSKLKRSKRKISPNKYAVETTAENLGLSPRHVRSMITEVNGQIAALCKKHGCTKDEAERFLLNL